MPPFIDFILHIDEHVHTIIRDHGVWAYGVLFGIIFAETGFVVMPFLPGDSLLFAVGMFAHPDRKGLDYWTITGLLILAAFLGDNVNYQVGKRLGPKLFSKENSRFFKKSYLDSTHAYFERYGGWTLVVARFVPIVRTFAPFVAGMGEMTFPRFLLFSIAGAVIWVGICVTAGYFFGQIPFVQDNFEYILIAVIFLSIIPIILKIKKAKKNSKAEVISG